MERTLQPALTFGGCQRAIVAERRGKRVGVDMNVRLARPDDEREVVTLWSVCGLVIAANDPVSDFRFASNGAASAVLVAEDSDAIVASAMVGHDGHRGWIYYLATRPSHRGLGLGRAMVSACEDWLRQRGVAKAQLLVRQGNAQVAGFYERLGYSTIPRIVMQKVLGDERSA